MKNKYVLCFLAVFSISNTGFSMTLDELLERAYDGSTSLKSSRAIYEAEDSLITAKASLDDPMIGISTLKRGNETKYGTISQKIRFPVKYYLQGKAQSSRAEAKRTEVTAKHLEIRKKVISLYYSIFASQKTIHLTEANMQAVREFSRVAERKYAAGKASQGDSMKAHFELTQLELELIRRKQGEEALQDLLRAELNDHDFAGIKFGKIELGVPKFDISPLSIPILHKTLQEKSPKLKSEIYRLKEAEFNSSLSKWEFAPDFQLMYQKRISGTPEDSEIFSVSMTLPLWFWKKSSTASAASAKKMAQEHKVRGTTDNLIAKVKDLIGKVQAGSKTLGIYKTSLIPQALSAYNSSRSSYRASKVSFLDLLDSERSLFRVKTGYYQSLKQYVEHLAALESQLGFTVSNLENKNGSLK